MATVSRSPAAIRPFLEEFVVELLDLQEVVVVVSDEDREYLASFVRVWFHGDCVSHPECAVRASFRQEHGLPKTTEIYRIARWLGPLGVIAEVSVLKTV
jgi:hypothetical protein